MKGGFHLQAPVLAGPPRTKPGSGPSSFTTPRQPTKYLSLCVDHSRDFLGGWEVGRKVLSKTVSRDFHAQTKICFTLFVMLPSKLLRSKKYLKWNVP